MKERAEQAEDGIATQSSDAAALEATKEPSEAREGGYAGEGGEGGEGRGSGEEKREVDCESHV
jgi:hypothetical protein